MSISARIGRGLQVESGEGWPLFFLFARAALIAISTVASSTYQSALFLAHFQASLLPWQYAAMALLTVAISVPFGSYQRKAGPVSAERLLTIALVAGMALGPLLQMMNAPSWVYFVFTMWVQLPAIFGNLSLWDTAIAAFEGRRARVLLPIVAAGSNIGAMVGGQLSAGLAGGVGNEAVLPLLMAAGLVTAWLASRPQVNRTAAQPAQQLHSPLLEGLRSVRSNALARNITLIILFSTALFLGVDFVFKKSLQDLYGADEDGISRYLGYFYVGLNLVVFVVQTAAMGRLMRLLGVRLMTLATPGLVVAGLLVSVAAGGILPALLAAIVAGSLRYTFFLNSRNQLATPLSLLQKSAAGFLNRTLVTPVGTVLAGLLFQPIRSASAQVLAAAASLFGVAMLLAAWRAAIAYRAELAASLARKTLQAGWGEEGFSLPDPTILEDLERKTQSGDPQEALFAASLLAQWGELKPAHLQRSLLCGLEAGTSALALSDSLANGDQSQLLADVLLTNPNLALRMDALGRARAMKAAWLADVGSQLWTSQDRSLRALGAVALGSAGQHADSQLTLDLAEDLGTGKGFLAALHQKLAAWLLVSTPQELHAEVLQRGYTQAPPGLKRAFIHTVGAWRAVHYYPVLEVAALDPHCGLEAMRALDTTGRAAALALQWMKQGHQPVRTGALLQASAAAAAQSTQLLEACLQHGRVWYLALLLTSHDRSNAPLPDPDVARNVEATLKRSALALAYAALKSGSEEERFTWDAEAHFLQQACFSWFRHLHPEWRRRLDEIEYTLPKADKRSRNAAMELLEEFARGGREWFVTTLDLRLDSLQSALRPYFPQGAPDTVPEVVDLCGDVLLSQIARFFYPHAEGPMNSLDPVLFQKALALRSCGFFKELASDVVLEIAARAQEVALTRRQVLFQEGDPPDGVYFVLSGELDVWVHGKVVNNLTRGMVLGEIALLDKGPRSAKLVAAEDSLLLRITPALFDELMETYPGVARGVITTLVEYLRRQSAPPDPSHAPSMSMFQLSES